MKKCILIIIFLYMAFVICKNVLAFGNKKTHPALSEKVVAASIIDDYLKDYLGMNERIDAHLEYNSDLYEAYIEKRMKAGGIASPSSLNRTALDWLKAGSNIEDEDVRWRPIRSRHHFHDPTRNAGLDNKPTTQITAVSLRGSVVNILMSSMQPGNQQKRGQ